MKSSEYWKERFILQQEAQLNIGLEQFANTEQQYQIAIQRIEADVSRWYVRFARNNEISMTEARRLLNTKELEEFRWTVKEYIKYGRKNEINQMWMKELENASARVHISRLESLKIQMQQELEVLFGNQLDQFDNMAKNIYTEGYYHTAYEIQKGFNVGWSIQALNADLVNRVVNKPWASDGKNFSKRIWNNRTKLVNTLHTELTQSLLRGDAPDKAIKNIAKEMNTSKGAAGRLFMTESAFFSSASQEKTFNDLSVELYQIVATLDIDTSTICQALDGKVLNMKDYKVGVTAPPFHPWCRTVTAPYFADDPGERIARGADGKTYYVPGDMTYPEWKKQYVDMDGPNEAVKNPYAEIFSRWDGKNVKALAQSYIDHEDLPLKVQRHKLKGVQGQCTFLKNEPTLNMLTYELNSADPRELKYQIKTMFHELYHAKGHGGLHDIKEIGIDNWLKIEKVFSETTAHYMASLVGVTDEIMPAYHDKLLQILPRLKKLPEFKDCSTLLDFGKVAYGYRFDSVPVAKWKNLLEEVGKHDFDMIKYSQEYLGYMDEHRFELVEAMMGNMPQYDEYFDNMLVDLYETIKKVKDGYTLTKGESFVFERALLLSMNRLGVK
jgi:SPP1 gp7 family putative phage head morphogenesis protein